MEISVHLVRVRNTGLGSAGTYRLGLGVVSPWSEVALVHWTAHQPAEYFVRGRALGCKPDLGLARAGDAGALASTPFYFHYDEEDVVLAESVLFHCSASLAELRDKPTTRLEVTLEFRPDGDGAEFTRIQSQVVVLHEERYGLEEFALVLFDDHLHGSAALELLVLCASQSVPPSSISGLLFAGYTEEERTQELNEATLNAANRILGVALAPLQSSLGMLRKFVEKWGSPPPPHGKAGEKHDDDDNNNSTEGGHDVLTDAVTTSLTNRLLGQPQTSIAALCKTHQDLESIQGPQRVLLWHKVLRIVRMRQREITEQAKQRWLDRARDVVGELFVRERCARSTLFEAQDSFARGKQQRAIAEKLRTAPRFSELNASSRPLTGEGVFMDDMGRPVVFEQRYELTNGAGLQATPPLPPKDDGDDGIHLVVLLHGFLGSRWDLRVFQLILLSLDLPRLRCKFIVTNENLTAWPLQDQGTNVAGEILAFAKDKRISRLSFVAYSMGAVVLRHCLSLPAMRVFDPILYTFVSIAGPHLGSTGGDSALVGMGQWALMRWKKIQSLSQLALEDDTLLRLAQESSTLAKFRSIALVSSADDTYVPSYSARMDLPVRAQGIGSGSSSSSRCALAVQQMQRHLAENALSKVRSLSKVDLAFEFTSARSMRKRMDAMLGREAHVHILDSVPLVLTLVLIFGEEWFA